VAEFNGHVFIGVSVDGFIARPDGDLSWLTERELEFESTGYKEFTDTIDALIMGRSTYEFVLGLDEWFYDKPVFVVSTTLDPASATRDDVQILPSIDAALEAFAAAGYTEAYVDGGKTIQSFLRAGLIRSIVITHAPVLIGQGARLFGELPADIDLELVELKTLQASFTQTKYRVIPAAQL
jgi:dihydrofolate reductase